MNKTGIIVYKATKWELFLSRFLPYYIPFISKRKRIKIKWYYKYRYRKRVANALVKTLMTLPTPNWEKVTFDPAEWEWTVETREKGGLSLVRSDDPHICSEAGKSQTS